jgi:hypothetical protein
MLHLMQQWKIRYFLTEQLAPDDRTVTPALDALLRACTKEEYAARGYTLARLDPDCNPPALAPNLLPPEMDPAKQTTVPPGVYDEMDPAVVFRGDWAHDKSFEAPYGHTVSYSDTAGAEVSIAFQGTSLTYMFTRAPNRGIASVAIDGSAPAMVDQYSPNPEWQQQQTFCCFTPGRHRVVIQVTGQANPKSTAQFVDVDSFVVK